MENVKKILFELYNNLVVSRVANNLQCFLAWFQQLGATVVNVMLIRGNAARIFLEDQNSRH